MTATTPMSHNTLAGLVKPPGRRGGKLSCRRDKRMTSADISAAADARPTGNPATRVRR